MKFLPILLLTFPFHILAFEQDTVITAGDFPIGVEIIQSSSSGAPWSSSSETKYVDSLGRVIRSHYEQSSAKSGSRSSYTYDNKIDDLNRIIICNYTKNSSSMSHSTVINAELAAETWNEMGMIIDGTLYKSARTNSSGGNSNSRDTLLITILYDTTDIIPVDTIIREATFINKVNNSVKHNIFVYKIKNKLIIDKVTSMSNYKVYDIHGRQILNCHSNNNKLIIDLNKISKGQFILKGPGLFYKINKS